MNLYTLIAMSLLISCWISALWIKKKPTQTVIPFVRCFSDASAQSPKQKSAERKIRNKNQKNVYFWIFESSFVHNLLSNAPVHS